jgi:hypothetical protein
MFRKLAKGLVLAKTYKAKLDVLNTYNDKNRCLTGSKHIQVIHDSGSDMQFGDLFKALDEAYPWCADRKK